MDTPATSWTKQNQADLVAAIGEIRDLLEADVRVREQGSEKAVESAVETSDAIVPDTLRVLRDQFALSQFESDILLLCAGVELEPDIAALCAAANGSVHCAYPSFSLALRVLRNTHWSATSPIAPLRRWHLLDLDERDGLTQGRLRLDERILHYLLGLSYIDERLHSVVRPLASGGQLPPSQQAQCAGIVEHWRRSVDLNASPLLQLCGMDATSREQVAARACEILKCPLYAVNLRDLPVDPPGRDRFRRLWQREYLLSRCALSIDVPDYLDGDPAWVNLRDLRAIAAPVIVCSRAPVMLSDRSAPLFDIAGPTADEQKAIWAHHLGKRAKKLNGQINEIVAHFDLSDHEIRATSMTVAGDRGGARQLGERLWEACRTQTRSQLDELAQRITPAAQWDDLVLPELQKGVLADIRRHLRQRATVYGDWGFAEKYSRGLGISALFSGESGTGKTMAAEVMGNELRLDVYRVDLSTVVSKYIGETEKNLRRIFDAAERSGAILLFDEADALFGKRSEVRDSHDRYANVEVAYLLQRMESYRGLAILTTNMKSGLDSAFLRRIRFVVHFPFPDKNQRLAIWRKVFPTQTRVSGLEPQRLAQLNVTGGSIRNIAVNAAFIAADEDAPVQMRHLLTAAGTEYTKLERPLTEAETGGWV